MRDEEGIAAYGTAALNVRGSYFSEYEVNGKPQYEDWVSRELAERIQSKQEFTVKTHRGVFHARVGARVKLKMKNEKLRMSEELNGVITGFTFRYRREAAFVATIKINEE
jgi:hypothetical protein